MKILGIETSCDETAAAVVEARGNRFLIHNSYFIIHSNIVSSQIDLHRKYGGVYPELAARAHLENILPAVEAALDEAKIKMAKIDAMAVTVGPGLIGSLLVGVETAKTLAYIFQKPIIPINHLEGHIAANFVGGNQKSEIRNPKHNAPCSLFPAICLIVSGGHTSLVLMKDHGKYQTIGQTRDDAAGEAFDKVAQLLGLSYPGGPAIEIAVQNLEPRSYNLKPKFKLPRPMINSNDFDFSFSGLKTAVLRLTKELGPAKTREFQAEIAAEFQKAVIDVLVTKILKASKKYKVKTIMLAGGVVANSKLRDEFKLKIENLKLKIAFRIPPKSLCTDNAAMIAAAGFYHFPKQNNWQEIQANANLKLS